jgi:Flp pilus assembly pilin Flp
MSFLFPQVSRFMSDDDGAAAMNLAVLLAIVVIVGLVASASITVTAAQ